MTPAVAMEAAPIAVPISIGPDMTNLSVLTRAVPFSCLRKSDVKPLNMEVMNLNFLLHLPLVPILTLGDIG